MRQCRRDGAIVLAELLIKDGQEERGRLLLAEIIERMNREVRAGRSGYWYYPWHPLALVLQKKIRVHVEKQRGELERMRAEGLVPDRTSGQQASQQAAER